MLNSHNSDNLVIETKFFVTANQIKGRIHKARRQWVKRMSFYDSFRLEKGDAMTMSIRSFVQGEL